ncbi:flagellin [Pseudorhodobacter sp. E13]|uniref:flagellin N-terminal helical domain-containing protein n=1 Tax=Pseudorhodobacter sp. E13 TaxID=2487931 RepID=UPI000F8E8825|nr:flagellin [Pseudorhodobacter sp. E13]RUS59746.1 flagellin [Pseudorhodobacter sp. E13]
MSSILTNNSAMVALQTLKGINKNMGQIQNEISTGKSVANAKDNAAVWAISKVMESDVKGFSGISDSLSLGSSTISVARQAAETTTDLLTEIKGKIVAAQEGNVDREKIQADISALRDQIKSVTGAAQFNGLNMVKGTDDVSILSSLDRSGSGAVAASQITVNRQDLSTSAGKVGNTAAATISYGSIAPPAAAPTAAITGNTTAAAGKNATIAVSAATATGNNYSININGSSINYTTDGVVADSDMADFFAGAVNALGLEGVSASASAGTLTISNTNAFEAMEVSVQGSQLAYGDVNGFAHSTTNSVVEQRAETIDFSATAVPQNGDSFTVGIAGKSYSYTAGKGESMEDVARGLKTAIDSEATPGIKTAVQQDKTTGAWSLAVDDATGGRALSLTVTSGGEASGGLFGLDAIDVTTDDGAKAALSNIETMISTSIDAAASFGSAQKRIDIQSDFVSNLSDALKSGIGSMVDADMEETSARLQALQVQQQLGVQALSIANQSPQSILSLFR